MTLPLPLASVRWSQDWGRCLLRLVACSTQAPSMCSAYPVMAGTNEMGPQSAHQLWSSCHLPLPTPQTIVLLTPPHSQPPFPTPLFMCSFFFGIELLLGCAAVPKPTTPSLCCRTRGTVASYFPITCPPLSLSWCVLSFSPCRGSLRGCAAVPPPLYLFSPSPPAAAATGASWPTSSPTPGAPRPPRTPPPETRPLPSARYAAGWEGRPRKASMLQCCRAPVLQCYSATVSPEDSSSCPVPGGRGCVLGFGTTTQAGLGPAVARRSSCGEHSAGGVEATVLQHCNT